MKIGILTLPLHTNYGGNIQAYALMTVLKRAGHEVWLINRQPDLPPLWKLPLTLLKRIVQKYLSGKKEVEILSVFKRGNYKYPERKETQIFIDQYITPQTIPFFSTSQLTKEIESSSFDAIIVGSDQVWRPAYTPNITDYFLKFWQPKNVKRISYAASFGTNEWEFTEQQTSMCKEAIQKFTSVSVRENAGVDLCKKYFDVTPTHVLDPTMLLESKDYAELIDPSKALTQKGLLVYVLDQSPDKKKVIDSLSDTLNLSAFHTNEKISGFHDGREIKIAQPMDAWLAGFRDADFVITDSFHACVFSILFRKPFFAYGNPKRGMTRFMSLLKMFELEDRLITSSDGLTQERIAQKINWENVDKILENQRNLSYHFLKESLA